MKTRAAFLFIFLCFLFACKKDNSGNSAPEYYVQYRINGILTKEVNAVNYSLARTKNSDPSIMEFQLGVTSSDSKNFFGIDFEKQGDIITGTYQNTSLPPGDFTVDYFKDYNLINEKEFTLQNAVGQPAPSFTITLIHITDKNIKGNFTGNYLVNPATNEIISITDGEFFLRRMK